MVAPSSSSTAGLPLKTASDQIFPADIDSTWPSELALLLACARMNLQDGDRGRIRGILEAGVDWNRLFRLTILHRMTAFLFRHLGAVAPDLVPEENLEFLRNRFLQDGAETLRDTAELLELLDFLRNGGVFPVPYKGPALAVSVYGNIAYRKCNDLDILVSRRDVPRARELLEEAGFTPVFPTSPAGREFLLKTRHSEIFVRDPWPIVELHWAFAKQRGVFPLNFEQLRPRLEEIILGGARVPVFAPEDQLLILCSHGANHMWGRLEWLCGVSELIRNQPLDWAVARERAGALNATKTLLLGASLASELLAAPVPEDVLDSAHKDTDVMRSAAFVKDRLAAGVIERPQQGGTLARDLFRLRLQSTPKAKVRYVLHRITTPGREDTRLMLPLGGGFIPLPALFRPFHLLGKLVGGVTRGSDHAKKGKEGP